MRIIIDIGHPAHVHLFKNFAREMQKKGHKVLFTCRDREFVLHLLKVYGFEYRNFGKHYKTITGKSFGIVKYVLQMLQTCLIFQPDIFLSHGSLIAALASYVIRKPHVAFEDTFNMEQVRLYMPFTRTVLTGDYPHPALGKREIRYPGYHELAYIHPNNYAPDPSVLIDLGIKENEKYAIIRFVGWNASHDVGLQGITFGNKLRLVEELSRHLRVFISSEVELPEELKPYRISIRPDQMHDALCFASLYVGESGTMATECGVMGTPAILFVIKGKYGVVMDDQAKYGIVELFDMTDEDFERALTNAIDYSNRDVAEFDLLKKRDRLLEEKIDVTKFLVWFIENYPDSILLVRENNFSWDDYK